MYKEEFKPLFHQHDLKNEEIEKVEKGIDPCKEVELRYKHELEELIENNNKLKAAVESLEREKKQLLEDKDRLIAEIDRKDKMENLINNLSNSLIETIMEEKIKLKKEIIDIIVDALKRILMTDSLPKEEALINALSKVFESGIELKGEINLYLNPEDLSLIGDYLERLKGQISSATNLNTIINKDLKEGEFIIETQKLWIERRYEDLILDVIEDIKNERGL